MDDEVEAIFQKLVNDPDFYPMDDDREEAARAEAEQQHRQLNNTRMALSMAKSLFFKEYGIEQDMVNHSPGPSASSGEAQNPIAGRSPLLLSLQEMDYDQLDSIRKDCEQKAKDWDKRKHLGLALAYRRKMFDIDEEVSRRADAELAKLQKEG